MDTFIARQAIYDRNGIIYGYELLYRSFFSDYYTEKNPDKATCLLLINSYLSLGFENLTNGKLAFINFTPNIIKSGIIEHLPPELIVIEILENSKLDNEFVSICKRLKKKGYRFALDDFIYNPQENSLLDIADIIKIDCLNFPLPNLDKFYSQLKEPKPLLVAEKIESKALFQEVYAQPYSLFQGFYLSRPVILTSFDLKPDKAVLVAFEKILEQEQYEVDTLEAIAKKDIALTLKILKLFESKALSQKSAPSIKEALSEISHAEAKCWFNLCMSDRESDNHSLRLQKRSVVRGRFTESLGSEAKLAFSVNELYFLGLFSLLDNLLNTSFNQIINRLPISAAIKKAYLREPSPLLDLLILVENYEAEKWENVLEQCNLLAINPTKVAEFYLEAQKWQNNLEVTFS